MRFRVTTGAFVLLAALAASGPGRAHADDPPVAPSVLVIETPVEGAVLAVATVHVEGTISVPLDGAVLRLNGTAAPVTNGRFAAELPTGVDGPFVVSASYGLPGAALPPIERHVVIDRLRPVLRITEPLDAVVMFPTRRPTIRGRVVDQNPGSVLVNGQAADLEASKDGVLFSAKVDLAETGETKVLVEAVDAAGNRADPVERLWSYEAPPKDLGYLTLTTPHGNEVIDSLAVRVKGRVARVVEGMTLRVNGVPAALKGVEYDAIAAAPADGPFTIVITYGGPGYAEARQERKVIVDSTPPVFAFSTFPDDETRTKEAVATVAGTLFEANLKSARSVFRAEKTLEPRDIVPRKDGSFSVGLKLRPGVWVDVTFEAVDKAGHKTEARKRFFYEPPGWDDLISAIAAAKAGDWRQAAFFLQRAYAQGLPRKLVPESLRLGVESWLAPPYLSITSPAEGEVRTLPRGGTVQVVVAGRLSTGRKEDVLWVDGIRVQGGFGPFSVPRTYSAPGTVTIRIQVLFENTIRATVLRHFTILAAP